ncbi:hypothetical protein EV424DRAFT_1404808, partial [Suillus variegatus]
MMHTSALLLITVYKLRTFRVQALHFAHICYGLHTCYNLMHTSTLLLVTLQASYPSGTSFTSYTCLLLLAYVLQSHTTIYQG